MIPTNDIWAIHPDRVPVIGKVVQSLGPGQIAELHAECNKRRVIADDLEASMFAGAVDEAARRGLPVRNVDGIAKVQIRGVITKGESLMSVLFGGTSAIAVKLAVRAARIDKDVKVINLVVDSPGGSVDGIAELSDEVYMARQDKRVIVQSDGMMASAAYWVGSQGDEIYARELDLIGSLGVRQTLYDMSGAFAEEGIKPIVIDTSPEDRPYKSAGEPGTEITEAQVADFQRVVDMFGDAFREAIKRGRNMTDEQVDAVFDGRVWGGEEALALGLIDGVQSYDKTFANMRASIMNEDEMMTRRRADIRKRLDAR